MSNAYTYADRLALYRSVLDERFGGVLRHGEHAPDGEVCALELVSQVRGRRWTDDPVRLRMPDLRALNDAAWSSDAARTEHLLPVLVAYDGWADWPRERRRDVVRQVALRTVREILPLALRMAGLSTAAECCATVETLEAADVAAGSAYEAYAASLWGARRAVPTVGGAVRDAALTARFAARSATNRSAAEAANTDGHVAEAVGESALVLACRIWLDAALESEP